MMLTARVFAGASLFAMLIVDICCFPVQKGNNPSAYYGGGYGYAAPDFGSDQGALPKVMLNNAPSKGVSTLPYRPASQLETRQPAAPVSSIYGGSVVSPHPDISAQTGTAFQSAPQDINWAVATPSLFSGGEEMPAGTHGVGSSILENVSPAGPVYQAGELSHFEKSFEDGDSQMETEEQGFLPPPPFPIKDSAGQGFTSQPQPQSRMHGSWGTYPYYDFMFLTGKYPPGTVTHSSSSYEQGMDNWQDVHYVRDYAPYNPGPAQQLETFTGYSEAPQSFEAQWQPVQSPAMAGYGQGGAQASLPASHGSFMQPYQFEEPTQPSWRL